MNANDSNMAANAICFAAQNAQEEIRWTLAQYSRPSTVYKPKLFPEGNMWCALMGENLHDGVAGFGETPAKAMEDFDTKFNSQKLGVKP